jgi:hypothetical protein
MTAKITIEKGESGYDFIVTRNYKVIITGRAYRSEKIAIAMANRRIKSYNRFASLARTHSKNRNQK